MARERWGNRRAFIVAAIGSAIGLGNVWRFPYIAYQNGGGAFFIPFLVALITTGIPLITLEYYLGIRYQKGPTEAYGLVRKNTNYIGWFSLGVSTMISIYYAVIMGWSWNYLVHSVGVKWAGNEKSFFFNNLLGISDHISNLGGLQWWVVLGNALTWLCIFLIIFKGVKVVGKIVTWTVGLPWLLMIVLIIRGITLKGAAGGLDFYLRPDFNHLLNPNVWLAAYGQVFFSLSLGFGIMVAYASYLPKDSDINTNAWVVGFSDTATSFFSGFAVFSILGYLAFTTGKPISEVAQAGPGLAFVVYPTAIAQLPGGIWAQSLFGMAFFFMLLTLGIDSAFSLVEAIVTSLKDTFNVKREKTCATVCILSFLAGTIYCTNAGLYWLDVVDHWMNWGLVIVGLLEAVLIGWFVDTRAVAKDIDSTSGIKFGKFWIIAVKYVTPVVLFATIVSSIHKEISEPYEGYPIWALMLGGWFLLISLLYLSIAMQKRKDMAQIKHLAWKFAGWLASYTGLVATFYFFYESEGKELPVVILIVSVIIAAFTFIGRSKEKSA
ncbi:MAG: sodium-dependent transporter [Bacteriovoracaceae bacterium]|nr:sodium-dependent transporter [Bacteriovoracaceae bacterium]